MCNMRILLMTPPVTLSLDTLVSSNPFYPPLSLAAISAILKREKYIVKAVDSEIDKITIKKALKIIKKFKPRIIGLHAYTSQVNNVDEFAKQTKNIDPSLVFVLGGPHVTALPDETIKRLAHIDVVVIGEGEYTILEIVEKIKAGKPLNSVKGICFRENGIPVNTGKRPVEMNLDNLPFLDFHLFP